MHTRLVQLGAIALLLLALAAAACTTGSQTSRTDIASTPTATATAIAPPLPTATQTQTTVPTHTAVPIPGENLDSIREPRARLIAERVVRLDEKIQRGETISPSDLVSEEDIDFLNMVLTNLEKNRTVYAAMTARANPPATPTNVSNPPSPRPQPTATQVAVSKTWPEVIKGNKITIFNHGNEMGVVPTDLAEIEHLATKLATYPAANGFEFHFYNWDQTDQIPLYAGGYDPNINWQSVPFSRSPAGKQARIPYPAEGIYRYYVTLPRIFDSYPNPTYGDQRANVIGRLNSYVDDIVVSEICGKGDWRARSQCDPETQAFMWRSFQDNSKSNIRTLFAK